MLNELRDEHDDTVGSFESRIEWNCVTQGVMESDSAKCVVSNIGILVSRLNLHAVRSQNISCSSDMLGNVRMEGNSFC